LEKNNVTVDFFTYSGVELDESEVKIDELIKIFSPDIVLTFQEAGVLLDRLYSRAFVAGVLLDSNIFDAETQKRIWQANIE